MLSRAMHFEKTLGFDVGLVDHARVGVCCIHGLARSKAADAGITVSSQPFLPTI